jgi:hypothetical protein
MRACAAAALATLALLACAPGAGASYTSEVLFSGSGSYSLYFLPDFRVTLRASHGEHHESRSVGVGPTGIVWDNDVASWGDLGCVWVDGKGIALGEAGSRLEASRWPA